MFTYSHKHVWVFKPWASHKPKPSWPVFILGLVFKKQRLLKESWKFESCPKEQSDLEYVVQEYSNAKIAPSSIRNSSVYSIGLILQGVFKIRILP